MVGYLATGSRPDTAATAPRAVGPAARQGGVDGAGVEQLFPGIVRLVGSDSRKPTLLALPAAPVIDKLVSGDADQPRDGHSGRVGALQRGDRGRERLGGQVLGVGNAAAPGSR